MDNATNTILAKYREAFESALLAYFCNEAERNREILTSSANAALLEGRLGYHEFFQGEISFVGNDFQDTLRHYDSALKEEPANSLFLANKAAVLVLLNRSQEAVGVSQQALSEAPDETHAIIGLVAALVETGKTARAKELAYDLLRKPDLKAIHRFSLLAPLVDLNEERKALALVDRLLAEFPSSIYAQALRVRIQSKLEASKYPEFRRRPYCRAFLVCDSIRVAGGKTTCEGIFDFINLFVFPSPAPVFHLFISFYSRRLASAVSISIRGPNRELIYNQTFKTFNGDLRGSSALVVEIRSLDFPAPGPYAIEARIDGKKIGSTPIVVQRISPRPDYTGEELSRLLEDPKTIKKLRVSFSCRKCNEKYTLQLNLDPSKPVDEGALPFPENDLLVCAKCGNRIDTQPMRLQARQLLGTVPDTGAHEPKTN